MSLASLDRLMDLSLPDDPREPATLHCEGGDEDVPQLPTMASSASTQRSHYPPLVLAADCGGGCDGGSFSMTAALEAAAATTPPQRGGDDDGDGPAVTMDSGRDTLQRSGISTELSADFAVDAALFHGRGAQVAYLVSVPSGVSLHMSPRQRHNAAVGGGGGDAEGAREEPGGRRGRSPPAAGLQPPVYSLRSATLVDAELTLSPQQRGGRDDGIARGGTRGADFLEGGSARGATTPTSSNDDGLPRFVAFQRGASATAVQTNFTLSSLPAFFAPAGTAAGELPADE